MPDLTSAEAEVSTPGPFEKFNRDYFKKCPLHGARIDEADDDLAHFRCGCHRMQYVPSQCPFCGSDRQDKPKIGEWVTWHCGTSLTAVGVVHQNLAGCMVKQVALLQDEIERLRRDRQRMTDRGALSQARLTAPRDEYVPVVDKRWEEGNDA